MPNDWPPSTAWRLSSFVKRISTKKIGSRKSSRSGGMTPAWCASSRPWNPVSATKLGTTRKWEDPSAARRRQMPALYFYFIDEGPGPGYVRVPMGCPFCLQVYPNGHHGLAGQLRRYHLDPT